ncbi:hypothetical protein ACFO0N_02955 [Halobium salinum]|uniref:Uncharacterized protein n=1 Tax=Halobium salinum TaxID=1364940 RepID=A0ABD5P8B1_9EURY|nr:hypothetical protein [Halobium salinum]
MSRPPTDEGTERAGRLDTFAALDDRLDDLARRVGRAVFGDRAGLALFLGALCFFALFWRVETLSNDNFANLNALVALAEGQFHVPGIAFGPSSGETPGMRYVDGRRVADNYGLVLLSLPALLFLRGAALVVDLGVAFAALWSCGLLAVVVLVGGEVGRGREAKFVGAGVALVAFLANLAVATPFPTRWLPLVALQATTAVAAALTAVVCYRLGCAVADRRVGHFAGVAAAAATPVGFWAVGPKQHAVTALFVTTALYALYRSRGAPTVRGETRFRAVAYACIGLTAWQHAGEALLLALALVPVDLATARRTDIRGLSVVAAALAVSALPFLATNAAVAGDPLQPLKLLPHYHGQELAGVDAGVGGTGGAGEIGGADGTGGGGADGAGAGAGATDGSNTPNGDSASVRSATGPLGAAFGAFGTLAAGLSAAVGLVDQGVSTVASRGERSLAAITDPDQVAAVFLRSGYVASLRTGEDAAINLSVLESMPLLAALAALPAAALRRLSRRGDRSGAALASRADGGVARPAASRAAVVGERLRASWQGRTRRPARTADAFAVAYTLVLLATTFDGLPMHHMLTVRYLHALYPLGLYGVLRSASVREAVSARPRRLTGAYLVAVAGGLAWYAAAFALLGPSLGEAVQLHGTVAFAVAVAAGGWAVLAGGDRLDASTRRSVGAVVLGVAAASTTTYLLVAGGLFSTTGRYLLPLSRPLLGTLFSVF